MDPYMRAMADLLQERQPPALVMRMIKEKRIPKPA
jgi:hypothetical protein